MTFNVNQIKYGVITGAIALTIFLSTGAGLAFLFCGYVFLTA